MAATVIFDLTVAIIIGILFSVIMFVLKVSDMTVNVADVDPAKIDIADKDGKLCGTKVDMSQARFISEHQTSCQRSCHILRLMTAES